MTITVLLFVVQSLMVLLQSRNFFYIDRQIDRQFIRLFNTLISHSNFLSILTYGNFTHFQYSVIHFALGCKRKSDFPKTCHNNMSIKGISRLSTILPMANSDFSVRYLVISQPLWECIKFLILSKLIIPFSNGIVLDSGHFFQVAQIPCCCPGVLLSRLACESWAPDHRWWLDSLPLY